MILIEKELVVTVSMRTAGKSEYTNRFLFPI